MLFRKLLLWTCWLSLLTTWINTLFKLWREGQTELVALAGLMIPSWLLLYFAEGLELAVAARVDAEDSPVGNVHHFFTRRQAVVILTVTFISLASVYLVEVPWLGRLGGTAPFWFSLVFVSLTTLWFAQVVPKRVAVLNPDGFLRSPITGRFLRLINLIGALFDGPSDDVLGFVLRLRRDLRQQSGSASAVSQPCDCAICRPLLVEAWSGPQAGCPCAVCHG